MLRLPRSFATLVTLLLASATTVATADATTQDGAAKPAAAAPAKPTKAKPAADKKIAKKKLAALIQTGKKGAKKLPQLPAPTAKSEKKAEEKTAEKTDKKVEEKASKAKKADEKAAEKKAEKAEKKGDEPPAELTGALPQAKLADKKATKKSDSKDEKSEKKADKKADSKEEKSEKKSKEEGKAKAQPAEEKTGKGEVGFGRAPKDRTGIASKLKLKTCFSPTVSFARLGQPSDVAFPLTTCDGKPTPIAIESLSVLARPYDVPAPKLMPVSTLGKGPKGQRAFATTKGEFAPGIRRVDPGLVVRLQAIANRFPGKTITLVSGYRPASKGSKHAEAQAFDLRVDGVTNETLVAFCKTLKDTGCGYYPNSFFVHVDVRAAGAGHVYWIDVSGPGEKPVYVKSWPPPLPALPEAKVEKKLEPLPEAKGEKQVATTTDEKTIEAVAEPGGDEH
jgi:hypothetical protein